jgi:hypothetical protein
MVKRDRQIKKRGSHLMSADGKRELGRYDSHAAAIAGAKRIYAAHGKRHGKKSRTTVKAKRFAVVCEGASVSESRSRTSNPGRRHKKRRLPRRSSRTGRFVRS